MRMGPSMAWICPLQPAQNDRAFHRPTPDRPGWPLRRRALRIGRRGVLGRWGHSGAVRRLRRLFLG